jgi:hypothetical protein
MYNQNSDGDDATSAHKSLMATALDSADAKTMEKFAHVSEKFVMKSVAAALAPYKESLMHFHQVQLDTVCMADIVLFLSFSRAHTGFRCALEPRSMSPRTPPCRCRSLRQLSDPASSMDFKFSRRIVGPNQTHIARCSLGSYTFYSSTTFLFLTFCSLSLKP